jgi:trimeric autotransporter adhesin
MVNRTGEKKGRTMNRSIHPKKIILPLLVSVLLFCFACLQRTQAAPQVVPAPDGCYPAFTTAEGCNALFGLAAGQGNTGVGWYSLYLVGGGNFNTGVGAGTLVLNTADSNTAVGAAALLLNTTGIENTAVGTDALVHNDTAEQNTATGAFALFSHTSGNGNTAIGANALFSDATGQVNTAIGSGALFTVNSGFDGSFNTAVGAGALFANTNADNTAVGSTALAGNTSGHDNTAVGISALPNNTMGSNNIALGGFAGQSVTTASHVIAIGSAGGNNDNSCWIGQIFGASSPSGSAVFIDANDRLGTVTSSKRFKEDIKAMDKASEALFALKPITFHYKKAIDPAGRSQFGLVAEDVEKVNPDLIVRDKQGKAYSVRYDQVNAMLLNEFLKEHRAFVEQQRKVEDQQNEIDMLKTELKEQRLLIQKVSDRIEVKSSASQLVAND